MSARRKSLLTLAVVPVVVLLSLVSLGVANAARSTHPAAHHTAIATPTITISMFAFRTPASVKPGTKVKIVNKDAVPHTVTSDKAGTFNVSVPGNSTAFIKAPKKIANYKFHCTIHSTMHGVLHVK